MQQQYTLSDVLEFEGVGLHTGAIARMRIRPQPAGTGLRFQLGEGGPIVPALAENVVETRRATVIGDGKRSVSTVEHILSALFGMGVDNALVEVDGPEIPAMDGSAAGFAEAIERVGRTVQAIGRGLFVVDRPFFYRDRDALLVILPAERFRIKCAVDFKAPIGAQYFEDTIDPATYRSELAPARTFGYLQEYESLLERGLARGGSLDNALVFGAEGALNEMRWPNEVVRHKVLDLIGDFALLGAWPQCEIVAIKTGHHLHVSALRELRAAWTPPRAAIG
jgi:UDP-3-O-[3-hydroxymyristoyl] N-acetylglucosamine deacetylase